MKVLVLKAFSYANDGISASFLAAGDEPEINDDLVPGLIKEGFVADPAAPVKPATLSLPIKSKR